MNLHLTIAADSASELIAELKTFIELLSAQGSAPSPATAETAQPGREAFSGAMTEAGQTPSAMPQLSDAPRKRGRRPRNSAAAPAPLSAADAQVSRVSPPSHGAPEPSSAAVLEEPPAQTSDLAAPAPGVPPIGYAQFRTKLQETSERVGVEKIAALLNRHGFQKVGQLDPEKNPAPEIEAKRAAIAAEADAL